MIPQEARDVLYIEGNDKSIEILQLKYHILSGASNNWCVYIDSHLMNGATQRFDSFDEANAYYESIQGHYVELVLFTQISTAVRFRAKGYEVIG